MVQSISGSTKIHENDYPYSYDSENEKIVVYIGMNPISLQEGIDSLIGQRFGMLSGGYTFFKLTVPLENDCTVFEEGVVKQFACANQIRTVEYFIDGYQKKSKYVEMRLQFPELEYFMPSKKIVTITEEQITFSRNKDTVYSFNIQYQNTIVAVSFDCKMEAHLNTKSIAESISEISLKFPETDDLEYIRELYFSVRNFFAFVCNRKNIGLRSSVLIGNYPTHGYNHGTVTEIICSAKQKMFFGQKYLEPLEDKKQVAKTPNGRLFSDRLKELFQLFICAETGEMAMINANSIHPSFKYRNLIDLEQSLHITATFEYYTRKMLPEISSPETIEVINEIGLLVDGYIETLTGKRKKKAKDFRKSLSPQVSLKDKIMKVYEGYSTWQSLKPILSEWFGEDVADLASVANLWRNELAHEKREYQPDMDVIKAVRLVEHINYCIVLRCAGFEDQQIKSIVSECLIR